MIAAITPENTLFSQANACGSAPSPLEYSLREACFPELNARLRAEGFDPPGKGLAAWVRWARIVQVDVACVTVEELVEEACAWAERVAFTHAIWTCDPRREAGLLVSTGGVTGWFGLLGCPRVNGELLRMSSCVHELRRLFIRSQK